MGIGRRAERILRRICVNNITIFPENQARKSPLRLLPQSNSKKPRPYRWKRGLSAYKEYEPAFAD